MGRINSSDGLDMYNTAVSLLVRHSLAIPPGYGAFVGRGGATYGKYGIGQSLVEMPLALLDQWAHALGLFVSAPQLFGSATNAWISALGVVVLYQLARDLGYGTRVALATAVAYGLTTLAWVYAKLDFSEPLLTLCLLLAALACHRFKLSGKLRWISAAGAALGFAVLTKYVAIALVPLFAVYLVLARSTGGKGPRGRQALALGTLGAPVLVAVGSSLAVNWARSGSLWVTGYVSYERPLNQPVPLTLNAAAALLVSPRYGLVFFASPVLLGVVGIAAFRSKAPLEAWAIVVLGAATLLLYATYPTWYAGWTWGPRFMVPLVPFLMLPAAEVFGASIRTRRVRWLVWGSLAAGLCEQVLGVLVNYHAVYELLPWMNLPTAHIWIPWQSPLLNHLLLLPLSLVANLGVRLPAMGVSRALVSAAPAQVERLFPFFWFSRLPQPAVALLIGAICAAAPLMWSGAALARQLGLLPTIVGEEQR
jgi:hypothetical protein